MVLLKIPGNLLGRRREIESLGSEVAAQKAALEALQKALEEKRVVRGKFRGQDCGSPGNPSERVPAPEYRPHGNCPDGGERAGNQGPDMQG